MKYLLDTDIVINFLRDRESGRRVMEEIGREAFAVSAITLAEFFRGVYVSTRSERERELIQDFLHKNEVEVLPVDGNVAERYGQVQGGLEKQGQRGGLFDILIAATAMVHELTLVTGNTKDFKKIEGLKVYVSESRSKS